MHPHLHKHTRTHTHTQTHTLTHTSTSGQRDWRTSFKNEKGFQGRGCVMDRSGELVMYEPSSKEILPSCIRLLMWWWVCTEVKIATFTSWRQGLVSAVVPSLCDALRCDPEGHQVAAWEQVHTSYLDVAIYTQENSCTSQISPCTRWTLTSFFLVQRLFLDPLSQVRVKKICLTRKCFTRKVSVWNNKFLLQESKWEEWRQKNG